MTRRLSHSLFGLLPLFVLAHFAHHLLTALPVPLLPMIRSDFGLTYTQSGLLVSAFTLSYGLSQLPAGWLADRVGRRSLITLGICGVALAGLAIGLSQTYVMLVSGLVLMGLFAGGYHPAAPPLISAAVEPTRLGRALGLHVAGGSASYFLAPLVGVGIASAWGWRGTFLGLAAPTFVFGAIFYVLLGRHAAGQAARPQAAEAAIPAPTASAARLRPLVGVMVLSIGSMAVTTAVIAFIPLFLVDRFGVGQRTAAAFLSFIYAAAFFAAPAGGYLADRVEKTPVVLATCLLLGPMVLLLGHVPFGLATGALLLLFGTVLMTCGPVVEALIVGRTAEARRSTVFGLFYFIESSAEGLLTPLMGRLIDKHGFSSSYALAGGFLIVLTLACGLVLWKERG